GISIDGKVSNWFSDNTPMRFEAYGWHVIPHVNGHDGEAIRAAILAAQAITNKPSIICCKTTIGWGSPNLAGTAHTHGAALGEKEVSAVRAQLNWPHAPFVIPDEIYAAWDARKIGAEREHQWQALFAQYQQEHSALAADLLRRLEGHLPANWQTEADKLLHTLHEQKQAVATRKASQLCLNHYANYLPEMMGGSADLTESNCTNWQGMQVLSADTPAGRYLHYGVREFGMSAIMNGMALYKGIIPFGGTFLTFSDYARNAIRLSSIMRQRVIFVYTHDSIGLGEDGPTHQPIEQLPSLRMMPGLSVWRPCDTVETAAAWRAAIERQGPTCLLFSRQALPCQERNHKQLAEIQCGAYILLDTEDKQPDAILIATGSEVALAMEAARQLKEEKISVRVVSMPSADVFLAQETAYQEKVLPTTVLAKIAIEAAASNYWYRFVGLQGKIVGLDRFGASAPAKEVYHECGFTVERIVAMVKEVIYTVASTSHPFQARCVSGISG
ncbi:MAG: transketolase, partial [Gammaproteobacteria bacterium]|nr:transketolase [Gammaproteobacteria bacterium]